MPNNVGSSRFHLTIPSYHPILEDDHSQNMRSIERWGNALPLGYPSLCGGVLLPDGDIVTAGVVQDWGGVTITGMLPDRINITAIVTGFVRNFSIAALGNYRLVITYDDGDSYNFGPVVEWTLTGGGSTDNREPISNSYALHNIIPTGNMNVKVQIDSNHSATIYQNGFLTFTITPANIEFGIEEGTI